MHVCDGNWPAITQRHQSPGRRRALGPSTLKEINHHEHYFVNVVITGSWQTRSGLQPTGSTLQTARETRRHLLDVCRRGFHCRGSPFLYTKKTTDCWRVSFKPHWWLAEIEGFSRSRLMAVRNLQCEGR